MLCASSNPHSLVPIGGLTAGYCICTAGGRQVRCIGRVQHPLRFLHRMLYRPSSTRPLPQTPRLSVLTIVKIPGRLLCSPTSWRVTTGRVLCVAVRCGRGAHVHTSGANDKNRGYPRAPPNTICVLQADLIDRQLDPLLHCEYLWRRERERARAQPCAAPSYC